MKIAYLHQYFTTPRMYGGTRSYEMARRLVEYGHEVHIVTSRRDATGTGDTDWVETDEDGIRVHWIPVPYVQQMSYAERMQSFARFAVMSAPRAARLTPDVVFATSTPLTIALPGAYASKRNRVPMVFEVRDLWPTVPIALGALRNPASKFAARQLERFAYRNAKRIVAASPTMKEGVVATGYAADRVTVIPNGCDFDAFNVDAGAGAVFREQFAWLGDRPLVVYTGTLGLVNGVSYLAKLAKATLDRDPEIRFLIVGQGKEEQLVRSTAEQLGVLNRNFFMHHGISKAEMPALLAAADIATSVVIDVEALWANSANKFFDALASGTPIAINHRGWQADLIEQTGAGLVFDARNVESAAETLVCAVRTPGWLKTAGVAARQLGRAQFDRDQLATRLDQVLRDAANRPEG